MYQTPRNYGQTSHPSFDIVVVMSFQFFSLDRWKTWKFFSAIDLGHMFPWSSCSCPPGGTMSQLKSIIPTKAFANVLPMSYHFSLLLETVIFGCNLNTLRLLTWMVNLLGMLLVPIVDVASRVVTIYVSTFHTKNMSMIHHSFATCRLCMSGFPFTHFACI